MGHWNGHLVAILEGRTLSDLTLDTAHDARRGFEVGPLSAFVEPDFARGVR